MKRMASITSHPDHAPGYKAIRWNWDWVTRPLFGSALAALVTAAIYYGPVYVALFAAIAGIAAAREWHRMVGEPVFGPAFFITSIATVAALAAKLFAPVLLAPYAIIVGGAVVAAIYAALRGHYPAWHGFGAIYIALPALALVLLRDVPNGAWIIVGMFLAIWSTDTGALITGNIVGGPRLWPAISPSKTWAGTMGGVALAAIVEAIFIKVLGGNVVFAALFGASVAVISVAGDLFESWVKRAFQRKDSGGLIPGHGGVLDRIDSTLATAPLLALAVLVFGLNPLFGAHP
ncbi:MAG: phosphatidate cytidylyltransferase [Alphaproteobacteria bacterium]|nr:phosphatidate cytidylyltransferase [Alphaproteobacteria bacterium]